MTKMLDPYDDPERRHKRVGSTSIEATVGDVSFALTGPPDKLAAIVKYIKQLNALMHNKMDG